MMNTMIRVHDDFNHVKCDVYTKQRDDALHIEYASFDNHIHIELMFDETIHNMMFVDALRCACDTYINKLMRKHDKK